MKNVFDFFDKIYCLNLPASRQRWKDVSMEFKKVDILDRVERIWAPPPTNNFKISSLRKPTMFGCGLSHLKAIVHAMDCGAENVLIFEDDIVFTGDIKTRMVESLDELPPTWDIFFLGGNPRTKLKKVSKNLSKSVNGNSKENIFRGAFSYAVSKKGMIKLFDLYITNIVKAQESLGAWDGITSILHSNGEGYIISPYVCTTNPCTSIINGNYINYKDAQDEQWRIHYG